MIDEKEMEMTEHETMNEFTKQLEKSCFGLDEGYKTAYRAGYYETFIANMMQTLPGAREYVEERLAYIKGEI